MKAIVYIDGQNFLYKASDVLIKEGLISNKQELYNLDIRGVISNIIQSDEELDIKYYGAKIKIISHMGDDVHNKSKTFSDNLRRLKNTLNKQNIKYIESGKLKLRDSDLCKNCGHQDLRFQEKGVDVGIAVDMIVDAYSGIYQQIIILSSDTDPIPAIKVAKKHIATFTYLGFSDKLTNAINSQVTKTETIRDSEIIEAYKRYNQPKLI
jgi:uncharacterized LabA/DUF88 family protein